MMEGAAKDFGGVARPEARSGNSFGQPRVAETWCGNVV